jgi:hypothetical protein
MPASLLPALDGRHDARLIPPPCERITMAYEYIEATTAIQVYGPPNDAVVEMIRMMATPGVSVSVKPRHLGGFTRLQPR